MFLQKSKDLWDLLLTTSEHSEENSSLNIVKKPHTFKKNRPLTDPFNSPKRNLKMKMKNSLLQI